MSLVSSLISSVTSFGRNWLDEVRRNHGLEHATVAVLFGRQGTQRLAGRAAGNGFFMLGKIETETLRSCAEEALVRMQRGEASLAVSPLCGTNLAVTGAVCAGFTMASLVKNRNNGIRSKVGDAMSASTVGALVSQPIGRKVQEHITTRADLERTEIVGVKQFFPGVHKVYTRRVPAPVPTSAISTAT